MKIDARVQEQGFTLLEVVVALTILAISLGVLFPIFSSHLGYAKEIGEESKAVLLAQSLIEQAGISQPLRQGLSSGAFDDDYRWSLDVQPYGSVEDQRARPIDAFEISASIFWQAGQKSFTVSTIRLLPKKGAQ